MREKIMEGEKTQLPLNRHDLSNTPPQQLRLHRTLQKR